MKCLVVSTHPLQDSLCASLTQNVVSALTEGGHEVVVENLYEEDFEPALTAKERQSYYSDNYDSSGVASQVERLQQAEALVLLFPTWWFGFPAMLKGWFDRVWGPGIAYDHATDFGPIKPRLNGLRKVLVVTTLGAPWWVDRLVMWQPLKRVLKVAILGACARGSELTYLSLYNSEKLDKVKVDRFTRKIERTISEWMPSRS